MVAELAAMSRRHAPFAGRLDRQNGARRSATRLAGHLYHNRRRSSMLVLRHVEWCCKPDMFKWLCRVVARRRVVDSIGGNRRGRTEQKIKLAHCSHSLLTHRKDLTERTQSIGSSEVLSTPAPCGNEWQHLGFSL